MRLQRVSALAHRLAERRKAAPRQELPGNARRQRLNQLHPDKLGREQSPAERAEYVKLTRRKRKR